MVLDTAGPIAGGTFDPDAQDLRAERSDGGGGFTSTSTCGRPGHSTPSPPTWVQVDQITAGATTDFCLYLEQPGAGGPWSATSWR